MGRLREEELRAAARCLGIHEPIAHGIRRPGHFHAGGRRTRGGSTRGVVRAAAAGVVAITFGPEGVSGHQDHRAASNLVTEVCLAGHGTERLYYVAFPESRCIPMPPPFHHLRCTADALVDTVLDCSGYLDAARCAIGCHRSQWNDERVRQFDALNRGVLQGKVYLRRAFCSHHVDGEKLFQSL